MGLRQVLEVSQNSRYFIRGAHVQDDSVGVPLFWETTLASLF